MVPILRGKVIGVDVVIEISGSLKGLELAITIIRGPRGKIITPSVYAQPGLIDLGMEVVIKDPMIQPVHTAYSRNYRKDLEDGIWACKNGIMPIDRLITHKYSFNEDDVDNAFKKAIENSSDYIKGVVLMK